MEGNREWWGLGHCGAHTAPPQGSLLLAWSVGPAVPSWRYGVLWEFLNISSYSALNKNKQTNKRKKRRESWRRKKKLFGTNKTNLKAKYGPKTHWVPNSSSDEPTLRSFGEMQVVAKFLSWNSGLSELSRKPSVAQLITSGLSSVKQATTSCSMSMGSFKILIKRPQLNRKDSLGELIVFPWPSVPISRCRPMSPAFCSCLLVLAFL